MNDITLTKQQFENEAFKHWLRTGAMYEYKDYERWIEEEELKEIAPREVAETQDNVEEQDEKEETEEIKSGETQVSDLTAEDNNFEIEEGKTYAVWSGGSCEGCQALNGTVYEVGSFGMMGADIPETHPNCKCELTILDTNMLPTKEKVPLKKWEKDQKKPQPVGKMDLNKITFPNEYTEGRKLGDKGENKKWSDMTEAEREAEKIKQLEKFMKSEEFKKNIKEAEKMRDKSKYEKYKWMLKNFPTGAKYDIKHGDPSMEHAGNFNYGAMGRAAGLSEFELKAGGGFQQIRDGTSDVSFYNSYADDPVDQHYIEKGIDYYDENYVTEDNAVSLPNNPFLNML